MENKQSYWIAWRLKAALPCKNTSRIWAGPSPVPELSFLPAQYRGWTRASKRRVQDNLHAHAQNDAIFFPKSGEKPYLEVLSRFGLWRDFLNDTYKQQFLQSDWLKNMSSLNPKSVEFHESHADPHSICFFITISKITKEIFAKICWQLKTPTRTWKCTRCIMQMSYLYASDFPFTNFYKIAQHTETIRKKCLGKD